MAHLLDGIRRFDRRVLRGKGHFLGLHSLLQLREHCLVAAIPAGSFQDGAKPGFRFRGNLEHELQSQPSCCPVPIPISRQGAADTARPGERPCCCRFLKRRALSSRPFDSLSSDMVPFFVQFGCFAAGTRKKKTQRSTTVEPSNLSKIGPWLGH